MTIGNTDFFFWGSLSLSRAASQLRPSHTRGMFFCSLKQISCGLPYFHTECEYRRVKKWPLYSSDIFLQNLHTANKRISQSQWLHRSDGISISNSSNVNNDGWLVICVCDKQGIPKCVLFDEEVKLSLFIWSCAQNFLFFLLGKHDKNKIFIPKE